MEIKHIGIVGLGLIGGSLAKAAKANFEDIVISAYDKDMDTLFEAAGAELIDNFSNEMDCMFLLCDIVFVCVPAPLIPETMEKLAEVVRESCIVTDVGSVKERITERGGQMGLSFIGGHPMAGSEKSGFSASKEYLFENAYYILTPSEVADNEKVEKLRFFIEKIRAIPLTLSPGEHDSIVGAISHVPHVAAAALVNMVKKLDTRGMYGGLAAGGFKDITRIASSNPEMWAGISLENKEHILRLLNNLEDEIKTYRECLIKEDFYGIEDFFASAKSYRDSLTTSVSSFNRNFTITVDVLDKPGIIASVSALLSMKNINIKNIGIMNNRDYESGVMQVQLSSDDDMKRAVSLLTEKNFTVHTV